MSDLDRILDRLGLDLPDADRKAWEAILARPDVSRRAVLRWLGEAQRWSRWNNLNGADRPRNAREVSQYLLAREFADQLALRPRGWLFEDEFDNEDLGLCLTCGRRREWVENVVEWQGKRHTFQEIPDPCLGLLPGRVSQACCGHGLGRGYVQGADVPGGELRGVEAARWMRDHGGNPPPEAFMLDPIGRAS